MPEFLAHQPGLLFVAATLLPLASFVLILLSFAIKTFFRSSPEGSAGHGIYQMMGGAKPGRLAAYVATGAIGLAFVLSLTGFVTYVARHGEHEAKEKRLEAAIHKAHNKQEAAKAQHELDDLKHEWAGQIVWAGVYPETSEFVKLDGQIAELRKQISVANEKGDHEEAKALKNQADAKANALNELRRLQPGTNLKLGFRIDMLAALMFVMVTFIGTLIHIFSMAYMGDELNREVADHQVHTASGHLHRRGRYGRFFLFLSLFCFAMLNLVLADNLFQVFISWELVGICSYLLIGFYFERTSASNAANKAFITNRVGDAGFIIGLIIIWTYVGTFNFEEIFHRVRAPYEDAHGEIGQFGGQIVRATPSKEEVGWYKVDSSDAPITPETHAVLFASKLGHYHNVEAGGFVQAPAEPSAVRNGAIPYWMLVAAGLGIFLGCVGKSAQFPLQVWLPDAMEGPTPVSALIHAATMVAAGVYLVGRCFPLFTMEVLLVIAYTGAITLFVAATIALVMTDIKKVLAYSTVSQLGYMMLALGIGGWVAGLFHLITHAFFKALLFLGSGSVIYGCHHEQEMIKMGGLYPKMKITALTMLMGVLAIAGTPLFSGWYSKDAILAQAMGFVMVNNHHLLLFVLPLLTAGLTTFYMFRMWYMTFTGEHRDHHVHEHAHESPRLMTIPLIVLAIFSVVVAWGWPMWNPEASWLEHQIHHAQPESVMADFGHSPAVDGSIWRGGPPKDEALNVRIQAHDNHTLAGNIALGVVLLAFALATAIYYYKLLDPSDAKLQFPGVYSFLANKWHFDTVYSAILVRPALAVAHWCRLFDTYVIDGTIHAIATICKWFSRLSGRFDNGIVDGLVNLIADTCYAVGTWLRNVQTGYLRSYVLFLVLAAVGIWVVLSSLLGASPVAK